jgi:hypothetical protein
MTDICAECGRAFSDGNADDPLAVLELRLHETLLLAEMWLRSSNQTTRIMGADLKQVVTGG